MYIYRKLYTQLNWINYNYLWLKNWEWGYKITNIIFNKYLDFYEYKLGYYIIATFLIYQGIKKIKLKNELLVVTLLFLNIQFMGTYINAVRQVMSISIFIYSIHYVYQKKNINYIVCILIASLFHFSSIILIFLPLINLIKSKKIIISMFILSKLSLLLKDYIIFLIEILIKNIGIFSKFLDKKIYLETSFNIVSLTNDIPMILILSYIYIIKKEILLKSKEVFILKGYLVYYFITNSMYYFSYSYRLKSYFIIFYILIISILIDSIDDKIKRKIMTIIIIIIFLIIYFFKEIHSQYSLYKTWIPYTNYFQNKIKEINYIDTVEYKTSSEHRKKKFKIKRGK